MVCIGLPAGAYLRAPVFESVIKMVCIRGSYVGNRKDSAEAIEFFRRGQIKAPFKVVGLSELDKVYDLVRCSRPSLPIPRELRLTSVARCTRDRLLVGTCLTRPSSSGRPAKCVWVWALFLYIALYIPQAKCLPVLFEIPTASCRACEHQTPHQSASPKFLLPPFPSLRYPFSPRNPCGASRRQAHPPMFPYPMTRRSCPETSLPPCFMPP